MRQMRTSPNPSLTLIDDTPINIMDYFLTFLITLIGAFVGGWIAFKFNRIQEKKKQEHDDEVERINGIYIPLCTAIEKFAQVAYGRDTGDYGEPSVFAIVEPRWDEYRQSLRLLFLAQKRRLMLENEMTELKAFYESTEDLNNQLEDAMYDILKACDDEEDVELTRGEAIRDIACYCGGGDFGCPPASNNQFYQEAIANHAPHINQSYAEYVEKMDSIYKEYLSKIGVSDMKLDISLFDKTGF